LELKNLPPQIALEFAQREAEKINLWASNLEAILPALVEWSDGNPGAILHMLKMAQLPSTGPATRSSLISCMWTIAWAADSQKAPSFLRSAFVWR